MGGLPSLFRRRPSAVVVGAAVAFFFANVLLIAHHITDPHHSSPKPPSFVAKECSLNETLVKSALSRVKTQECRQKIEETACRLQEGTLYPKFPLITCPNFDEAASGESVGCFFDSSRQRLLTGHSYKFPGVATQDMCRLTCQRAGFIFFGVEYGHECFCGDAWAENATQLVKVKCERYPCPGNELQTCGGYEAIHVFKTGLKEKISVRKSSYVAVEDKKEATGEPVRIFFLLQFNGRNVRQVTRLLKAIYSPHHLYYIHVDSRQDFMHLEMSKLVEKLESMGIHNVRMAKKRWATIWGGASLLHMLLDAIRSMLSERWDVLLNLSESDFPILTMAELEAQLRENQGMSFLASHGHNTARFIEKQGFEYAFLECESHMWRDFGFGLRLDGGSDWVVIAREFAEFAVSSSTLPSVLRHSFEYVILPVESFFHTLAANSEFCDKVIYGNLRLTNWNRKQGCRCASLKKVVDWCGCSPLVFRDSTTSKFAVERSRQKATYFSRKFESLVDVTAIHRAEEQALGDRSQVLSTHSEAFNSVHVNFFSSEVDKPPKELSLLASTLLLLHEESRGLKFDAVRNIEVFRAYKDAPLQLVFRVDVRSGGGVELLVERLTRGEVFDAPIVDGLLLKNIHFGMQIDHKEELFRNYPALLNTMGTAEVLLSWERVKTMRSSQNVNKTSPEVDVTWRSPSGLLNHSTLAPYDSIYGSQFTAFDLSAISPTESGVWTLLVHDPDESLIAKVEFPVFNADNMDEFSSLVSKFYRVIAVCSVGESCSTMPWSSFFPDPKSQVQRGFDTSLSFLT